MKKLLEWAVVAMFVGMALYFGVVAVDASPFSVGVIVAGMIAVITVAAISIPAVTVAFIGTFIVTLCFTFGLVDTTVILAALMLCAMAFCVARKLGLDFKWVFVAYLIEGAGIYATLKLGLWQPAAVAALLLGIWWLALWRSEKRSLQLASV